MTWKNLVRNFYTQFADRARMIRALNIYDSLLGEDRLNAIEETYERTGIKPRFLEDVVQGKYRGYVLERQIHKLEKLQKISGIKPSFEEEDFEEEVQKAYRYWSDRPEDIAKIEKLVNMSNILPHNEYVQRFYSKAISGESVSAKRLPDDAEVWDTRLGGHKTLITHDWVEMIERMYKLTGIRPEVKGVVLDYLKEAYRLLSGFLGYNYVDDIMAVYNITQVKPGEEDLKEGYVTLKKKGRGEDMVRLMELAESLGITIHEKDSQLLDFIEQHGTGPRPLEITRELDWTEGQTFYYLKPLHNIGILSKQKEGRAVRYSIR